MQATEEVLLVFLRCDETLNPFAHSVRGNTFISTFSILDMETFWNIRRYDLQFDIRKLYDTYERAV